MFRRIVIALTLVLTGCVHPQVTQLNDWAGQAIEQAKAGHMKWSDYYKGLYNRVAELPEMQGKAFYLRGSNLLIDSALAVEAGKISKEQFESFQREMVAAESEYAEKIRIQNAAAWAQAAATYNQFLQTQATRVQAWQANRPINCTSQKSGNIVTTNCQ
ncbi:MAG: hypothetical protein ING36_09880 [Burkholderiales bacterium]|jgi:hypothetical protein|nr:hypothetical protein [Burkholderiales bacterium]